MNTKFRRFLIHKLGGILHDEVPPIQRPIKYVKVERPIVKYAAKTRYETNLFEGSYTYASEEIAHRIGEQMLKDGAIVIETMPLDDWETELIGYAEVVGKR